MIFGHDMHNPSEACRTLPGLETITRVLKLTLQTKLASLGNHNLELFLVSINIVSGLITQIIPVSW